MKVKTSELTGAALAWTVFVLEGRASDMTQARNAFELCKQRGGVVRGHKPLFAPHLNWEQGGPIIDREFIAVFSVETYPFEGEWAADIHRHQQCVDIDDTGGRGYSFYDASCRTGPTPLIAAMRRYVASKLGDEVDVPDELLTH